MNLPRLRFKEFSGAWEVKKAGVICDFIVPGRNKPTEFEGDIPWITTPDIEQNGIVLYSKKNLNINKEEAKNIGSKIVPKNSVIISCVGELGLVAVSGTDLIINQQLHAFIPKENIYFRFLLYALTIQKPYMEKIATKTAVPYMNKDNCNSIPVIMPTLPEQTKIANFLMAVDEKIAQLTQKGDLLARYKKGVMQQIFSQQLRFKDDDGVDFPDWEEKELGGLCSITTGKLDANAMVENGEYRFYTCAKEYYQIDKYAFDTDALLVSGNGANVGYIHHYKGKFNAYQRTYVLDGFEQNIVYVRYFLDANLYARIFKEKKDGNTPYIVLGTLAEMQVLLPSLPEQTKIANFLTAIDEKISHNQTQLNAVKQYKQGLLQQMFV